MSTLPATARHALAETRFLAIEAARGWFLDGAPSMGAALAFYTLFSMAPLLLMVIAIAGLLVGGDTARDLLMARLADLLGERGAGAVGAVLDAADNRADGILAIAASVALLVAGASTVFAELRRDLDRILRFEAARAAGVHAFVRGRLLSFGIVLGVGFVLMVSLVASAFLSAAGSTLLDGVPGAGAMLRALELAISVSVMTALFAAIYRIVPSARLPWSDVWIGAAVTSMLFCAGKYLIGLYIGKSAVASPFGAAGTLVAVIVWVYYSAQVFFLGAEFTRARAWRHGSARGVAATGG